MNLQIINFWYFLSLRITFNQLNILILTLYFYFCIILIIYLWKLNLTNNLIINRPEEEILNNKNDDGVIESKWGG